MAETTKKPSLLRSAYEAISQGNHAEAIRCCKQALKQDNQNYDAMLLLGKALYANKQFDQAEMAYRRAVSINAKDKKAWQGLQELYGATGNFIKAAEACESIIDICQSSDDQVHLVEYLRRLAVAQATVGDHEKAIRTWKALLETSSLSEALHLEAYRGIVDAKVILMETFINDNAERHLCTDNSLDNISARVIAENEWARNEENRDLEKFLVEVLKKVPNNERYEALLLQLLMWRMRLTSSIKGEDWRQLCSQVLQLCLSTLQWHASSTAMSLLLALCEEDRVDEIFNYLGMVELAQGRESRLLILGRKLIHAYPDEGLLFPILAMLMHQSPSCSIGLGQKRSLCEYGLRMDENNIVGWQVLAQIRTLEDAYSSVNECVKRGLKVISKFRLIFGLHLEYAELNLKLVLGNSLIKAKNYDAAAKVIQNILESVQSKEDPVFSTMFISAMEGQVKLLLAQGRAEEASKALSTLIEHDRFNPWALAEQGWLAYQKQNYKQAIDMLEQAASLRPQTFSYHFQLGLVYLTANMQKGDKDKALSHLLESARLDSSRSEVFRVLGHYYKDVPNGEKRAIRCYQKAILLNYEDEEAGEALCDLLECGGQELLELTTCREASQKSPRSFWAFRRLGYLQVTREEWSEAIKSLQHAVRGYPACADVWEALALAYQQLGMLTAALKAYSRVIALNSGSLFALQQSGNVLLMLGTYRKALAMFQTALEKSPEHPASMYGLASAYLGQALECRSMGAICWSASLLKEAALVASHNVEKHGNIVSFWKLLGDIEITYARNLPWNPNKQNSLHEDNSDGLSTKFKEWKNEQLLSASRAKRAYQHAIHLQPQQSNLYADLSLCLGWINMLDTKYNKRDITSLSAEAVACCGLAVEANNADLWTTLGVIARHKGLQQHAFIQALHVDGNHALAWAKIGQLYLKEGKEKLAKEAFTHARSADPSLALTWALMSSMQVSAPEDKLQEALANLLYASQLFPVAEFQIGLAKIAALSNELDSPQVRAAIEQSIWQVPDRPEAHNFRGLICELHGNYSSAIEAFQMSRAVLDSEQLVDSNSIIRSSVSINLARVLCKAGHAQLAVKEYELLAKSGSLEDSSALRGYATALWEQGNMKLAISIARIALKKSPDRNAACAAVLLLVKFLYFFTGPDAALEEFRGEIANPQLETILKLTIFAIASASGQIDMLLTLAMSWDVFHHVMAVKFISLLADGLQLTTGQKIDYTNAIHLLQKAIHLYPQIVMIRTKLTQLFLQRSDGIEICKASRCADFFSTSRIERTSDVGHVCEMLGATAVACCTCGSIKSHASFSSCQACCNTKQTPIQVLERWVHLEPWNLMAHYQLVLCLMQQAREQRFPVGTCRMIQRMSEIILARISQYNLDMEVHTHIKLQMLLCVSEVSLHLGNDKYALETASHASVVDLLNWQVMSNLQLARCHYIQRDFTSMECKLRKILNAEHVDFSTWLSVLNVISVLGDARYIELFSTTLDFTASDGLSNYQHIAHALAEWKKSEWFVFNSQLSMAEESALNAAKLLPGADALHLWHGAVSLELMNNNIDTKIIANTSRRLMKVVSGSVHKLPIAALLLVKHQSAKAGTPGWVRLILSEWSLWPQELKPAELCFHMGLLAQISQATTTFEDASSLQSPRAWFRRAVHTNPSCDRYWAKLREIEVIS